MIDPKILESIDEETIITVANLSPMALKAAVIFDKVKNNPKYLVAIVAILLASGSVSIFQLTQLALAFV